MRGTRVDRAGVTSRRWVAVVAAATLAFEWTSGIADAALATGRPVTFEVSSQADGHDASPGDGVCADAGGICTLRAAVEEANGEPGASISVGIPSGAYTLDLGTLRASADHLTLEGAGETGTVVKGAGTGRVMQVAGGATVTLTRLAVQDGNAGPSGYGGGILSFGHVVLIAVAVVSNTAVAGGGVANDGGTLVIARSPV